MGYHAGKLNHVSNRDLKPKYITGLQRDCPPPVTDLLAIISVGYNSNFLGYEKMIVT